MLYSTKWRSRQHKSGKSLNQMMMDYSIYKVSFINFKIKVS